MAKVPIEIIRVGRVSIKHLEKIIEILNKTQDAFEFNILKDDTVFQFNGLHEDIFTTKEIYDQFILLKNRIKGYHPHLIGIVDKRLNGKQLRNLFGSMKQENSHLEGMAVFTLYQIPQLLGKIPTDVYVMFEILSFAIRFLYGEGLIHNEQRNCVFDLKINKIEIVNAVKFGKFCESCEKIIENILDEDQEIALERIFRIIKEIAVSDDPKALWDTRLNHSTNSMPRIFLCHSSQDKNFVRRLANDLVDNNCRVWFDEWDIKIGDNIVVKINDGLQESDFLAIILSQSSIESAWVKNEWSSKFMMAAQNKKGVVLPLLIEDCEIPPLLKPIKYADFRNNADYEQSLNMVIKTVTIN